MLTFFTTPRPFRGRDAILQRNALTSWLRLHPDVQILLFGDAPGSMEFAWELGLHFEPQAKPCDNAGAPRVAHQFSASPDAELRARCATAAASPREARALRVPAGARATAGPRGATEALQLHEMFGKARQLARHRLLCYIDSRMLLLPDFSEAFNRVEALYPEFLMVGRRWDVDISQPVGFAEQDWQDEVRHQALATGKCHAARQIDYLMFSHGLFPRDLPPLPLGSGLWNHWLIWRAVADGSMVVDVSDVVLAIHQNHEADAREISPKMQGKELGDHVALCGGSGHLCGIDRAPYRLTAKDVVPNRFRRLRNWCRSQNRLGREAAMLRRQNEGKGARVKELSAGQPLLQPR